MRKAIGDIASNSSVASLHRAIVSVSEGGKPGPKQQPFSQQKSGQRSQNLHSFVSALSVLSGGDEASLLAHFLEKTALGKIVLQSLNSLLWKPFDQTMVAIKQQMDSETENNGKRKRWISLVSEFDSETLRKRFKMTITPRQYDAAKNIVN